MDDLERRILAELGRKGRGPLDKVTLGKLVGVSAEERRLLREALKRLETAGRIVPARNGRYALPSLVGLLTGRVMVFPSGNGRFIADVVDAEPKAAEGGGTVRPKRGGFGAEGTEEPLKEAYVASHQFGVALHGDRVVVEEISSSGVRFQATGGAKRGGRGGRAVRTDSARREVRVIRVIERANELIVGTVEEWENGFEVVPDDARIPHRVVLRKGLTPLPERMRRGLKVVVKVDPWEKQGTPLRGEVIEVLGEGGDPAVEFQAILRRYGLSEGFPEKVMEEASQIPAEVSEDDDPGRMDLRNTEVITIDPDDARDFDDAICVTRHGPGWEAWVHVADVSHYVKSGSALDREASVRGNSTYLPGKVIPMLPEVLSNGLCSLKPAVDRMAFSVRLRISSVGKVCEAFFAKTRIRSMARLTYRQAFAILEDRIGQVDTDPRGVGAEEAERRLGLPYDHPRVVERVKDAWTVAAMLRKRRMEAGSLDLDFPEVKIWVDGMGRVSGVERVPHDISHQLIEEFMLAANEAVAREVRRRRVPGVYRIHEDPDDSRLLEFREKAAAFGLRCGDLSKRDEVRKMLLALDQRQDGYALKLEFLKSLKRAVYSNDPRGHYGLAKRDYTHFTSPIRRYADLLVHRVLAGERVGGMARLQETTEHISRTERISADAEKEASTLKKLEYFERQLASRRPDSFAAVVVDIRPIGLIVELPNLVMSGLVHVNAMPGDYFVFDPNRRLFRGRRTGRKFHVGMELEVIVGRVDRGRRQVDFVPVDVA